MPVTLRCHSPLWGDYLLVPHPADEHPGAVLLGYVQFVDDDTLHRAIRRKGEWRDHRNRPFTRQLATWYSLEKPDGKPLF